MRRQRRPWGRRSPSLRAARPTSCWPAPRFAEARGRVQAAAQRPGREEAQVGRRRRLACLAARHAPPAKHSHELRPLASAVVQPAAAAAAVGHPGRVPPGRPGGPMHWARERARVRCRRHPESRAAARLALRATPWVHTLFVRNAQADARPGFSLRDDVAECWRPLTGITRSGASNRHVTRRMAPCAARRQTTTTTHWTYAKDRRSLLGSARRTPGRHRSQQDRRRTKWMASIYLTLQCRSTSFRKLASWQHLWWLPPVAVACCSGGCAGVSATIQKSRCAQISAQQAIAAARTTLRALPPLRRSACHSTTTLISRA